MSGLLPSDTEPARTDAAEEEEETASSDSDSDSDDVRVLWLDDEESERLISSLSSDTARSVLTALHERPATASELSDEVETSLQNVRHHLGNLEEAGLVHVSDTRYSVKGRKMNVYAPTDEPMVVCVGREDDRGDFLDSLKELVGVAALVGLVAALVQSLFGAGAVSLGGPGSAPRIPDAVGGGGEALFGLLPPGVAFLAGGLLAVVAVAAVRYYRQ
jgi:DNA-binding transcriptional ArsR family regulator